MKQVDGSGIDYTMLEKKSVAKWRILWKSDQEELIALRKEYKRMLIENEILKKAALIFAQK